MAAMDDWKDYRTDLVKMYGNVFGTHIYNRKVTPGMSKRMCQLAVGSPDEMYIFDNREEWVYTSTMELTFKEDKLVKLKYL
jgi:hypothetical protein